MFICGLHKKRQGWGQNKKMTFQQKKVCKFAIPQSAATFPFSEYLKSGFC
jgi:hypothetical protein